MFEVIGEESGEWLVLDGKRHPPRVICRCRGWNAPKNAAMIVAALEAHHSELHSKFPLDGSGGQPSNLACHQARLNLRLHQSLQPESPGQDTGARRRSRSIRSETQLLPPPPNRPRWFVGLSASAGGKRMVCPFLLRGDLGGLGLALDGASKSFLRGAIIEILDLLVVLGFPVDEDADGDVEIVSLVGRDHAFCHGVGDGFGHGVLCRTEQTRQAEGP